MRERASKSGDQASATPIGAPTRNEAAAELGRRGGKKGGAVRAARMTPEERTASARRAAAVRWARVPVESGEPEAAGGGEPAPVSGRPPKPFVFTLKPEEALEITEAKGSGGHQGLHRRLVAQLARDNLTVTFDDRQFGELIRYMTRYESGGFQGRLQRAFRRVLRNLFSFLDQ